jgi:hypothetical protein
MVVRGGRVFPGSAGNDSTGSKSRLAHGGERKWHAGNAAIRRHALPAGAKIIEWKRVR